MRAKRVGGKAGISTVSTRTGPSMPVVKQEDKEEDKEDVLPWCDIMKIFFLNDAH